MKDTIVNKIFSEFENRGYTITDSKDVDYDEDFRFVKFRIKGCKRWLWGIWIIRENNEYDVQIFGEHEDYIDKFKPSATEIAEHALIHTDNYNKEVSDLVWSTIYNQIEIIKASNAAGKIKFYYGGNGGIIHWLLSEWWFYRVANPIQKWLKYKGNKFVCMLYCLILNVVYSGVVATYEKMVDCFYPTYEIYINYKEGTDDDYIYKVYKRLNGSKGFNKSIRITHIPYGKTRGIEFVND